MKTFLQSISCWRTLSGKSEKKFQTKKVGGGRPMAADLSRLTNLWVSTIFFCRLIFLFTNRIIIGWRLILTYLIVFDMSAFMSAPGWRPVWLRSILNEINVKIIEFFWNIQKNKLSKKIWSLLSGFEKFDWRGFHFICISYFTSSRKVLHKRVCLKIFHHKVAVKVWRTFAGWCTFRNMSVHISENIAKSYLVVYVRQSEKYLNYGLKVSYIF